MSEVPKICLLPGDGIGPEIVSAARAVLEALGEFEFEELPIGGLSIDQRGEALTDQVLGRCREADAVLLGAVGGPKWDTTDPSAPRPEQGLLGLRKGLGLYANLRPVRPLPALIGASPLRREVIEATDLLVVRELTGGIYFGAKERRDDIAQRRVRLQPGRDRADRAHRVRVGAEALGAGWDGEGDVGRQGKRARDLAAVARGRQAASPASTPR